MTKTDDSKPSRKIILIDGSGYIFRAYYAITRLTNSRGQPTNAVYGFCTMLLKLLEVEKPTYLGIAFDTEAPSFRKERYSEYKSNRQAPPEDLVPQFPWIRRAAEALGIRQLEIDGFEADDILATLAARAKEEGYQVEIVTGDKDLMQLVEERVTLYDPMKDKRTDSAGVVERFGVKPDQVADLLALMGDSSDNIPGVTGIGEKTAAQLIQKFGSIEGIYAGLDEVAKPKLKENLAAERDIAFLSKWLATVSSQVPIEIDWASFLYQGPPAEKWTAFLKEMEFRTLLERFEKAGGSSAAAPKAAPAAAVKPKEAKPVVPALVAEPVVAEIQNWDRSKYRTLRSEAELRAYLASVTPPPHGAIALDTETTSLTIQDAELVGISMCAEAGEAVYVPLLHEALDLEAVEAKGDGGQIDSERAKSLLKPFLENASIAKVGQNLKYDLQVFKKWGIEIRGIAGDTMLASYLLNVDEAHGLDALALKYFRHEMISYESVTGKGKNQVLFSQVDIARATEYAAEDADAAWRLHEKFEPKLKSQGLVPLYREVELPLVEVLADMEYEGICVDAERLQEMGRHLSEDIRAVQAKIYEQAGEEFNVHSPKQLSRVLFEKLGLPVVRKTKTGFSTDEAVLEKLGDSHPICGSIVRYRELGKLKSTYVDGLLSQIHKDTGRVHTSFNQTVAATGRLSSSNPNLQNIPVGGSEYDLRKVFKAREGYQILSADYSQIELRLLADFSRDPELVRAFETGEDVHTRTAQRIFGRDEISSDERRIAKTINFGVIYGQSAFGLAQQLKIPAGQAKEFIQKYFAEYAHVRQFLQSLAESARRDGFAVTRLGRRRYLPEIASANRMQREMAERAAINTPLQGTAADMIKKAMVGLHHRLRREKADARMVLQVHDELVLEVAPREADAVEKIVREEMVGALPLSVPLLVDVSVGDTWA